MERPTGARTLMSPLYALVRAARDGRAISIAHPNAARDWTHASDIGLGIRTLLEAPAWDHDCYNLSSGRRVSFGEVADTVVTLAPGFSWRRMSDGPVDIDGAQAQRRGPLDISRLTQLGFAPRYAIREGLEDTLRWLREIRLP
jgi:nucleoside-diphosphate-sugar epimerase